MTNKKYFLSFGNRDYYTALDRIKAQAKQFNIFDFIFIFNDKELENFENFWKTHQYFILENPKGHGYWLWKPFLVLKTLEKMDENDILVYADAGCNLNIHGKERLGEYFVIAEESKFGILSFQMGGNLEKSWTKMDLIKFLDCSQQELNSGQLIATAFVLRKCFHSVELVRKWFETSCLYHYLDDSKSKSQNDVSFHEHRHDQSIFSILRKKYGTEILQDETWFHPDWINDGRNYPIWGTRSKN